MKIDIQPRKWLDSVNKFLQAWSIVRICPDRIAAPRGQGSFNILTLAISVMIVLLARLSVAGSNTTIDTAVVATIISVALVFFTGYVNLVLRPGPNSLDEARKWGTFFVMTWLTSLLLLIALDALPFWLGYSRLSTTVVDAIAGPDGLSSAMRDFLRAIAFGLGALAILLFKTKRMDKNFRIADRCSVVTIAIGLLVNTLLLGLFVYGHLI